MQTFLRRFSVIAGFALLVLLLAGNALITKRQLNVQISNQEWVLHTRHVLYELEQTESLLLEAETGQRGYLLTGKPEYLEPYNHAVAEIDGHIAALASLTADNPTEQANVEKLRMRAHQKLDELAETIGLYRAGNIEQAKAIVASDRGLVAMENVRQVISTMENEEDALETTRTASYQRSITITNACILLATLAAAGGLVMLAYYILREHTVRDRHIAEIHAREEWFRVTLTSIGDAVIATDRDGVVTFFNPVAEKLTGISAAEATGRDVFTVFPIFNEFSGQVAENPVSKVMSLGVVVGLANHTALRHADGRLIPIEDSAAPIRDDAGQLIGVVLVFHDVSAERKSQEMLRRTEKLAAAARLSATVAHEINNPLEAVVNLIFLAKNNPGTPDVVVQHLTLVDQEIERVAHITRQTLGFYRESGSPEQAEIVPLVESILRMYSKKIDSNGIRVQRNFDACPPVLAVVGELKQAVSNILSNAIDAAGEQGVIVIRLHTVPGGQQVELVIADSGQGISPELAERIFEPFYTTKKDVGTGLGLWVTKEIIERHGGAIEVRSASSGEGLSGAAFVLRLPCASITDPRPSGSN